MRERLQEAVLLKHDKAAVVMRPGLLEAIVPMHSLMLLATREASNEKQQP